MDWRAKAAGHQLCSVPGIGQRLHHRLRRFLRQGDGLSDEHFALKVDEVKTQLGLFQKHQPKPLSELVFYEFGAGWELAGPVTFWCLGVERQILVDRQSLSYGAALRHTLEQAAYLGTKFGFERVPDRSFNLEARGITYLAPVDAAATGFEAQSVDRITSFNTLEHIPAAVIPGILGECRRLLAPNGLLGACIDCGDHYSYADKRIGPYNFLRYSDPMWRWFNPSSHYQNRLRHIDYLDLFNRAGFELLEVYVAQPGDEALLRQVPLAKRFRCYRVADLLPLKVYLVARLR